MSRFLKVMIVMLAVAAMAVPATVFAADNLSLGGSMRVRGAYLDDGGDYTTTKVDHRLRVGGKFTATDNISLTFRTDFSEGQWGSDSAYGRFSTIKDMDRAHLDIDTDSYHFRAGTQYWAFGKMYAFDHNGTGATLTIKGAAPITIGYALVDNNDTSKSDAGYTINQTTGVIEPVAAAAAANNSDDFAVAATTSFGGLSPYAVLFKASDTEIYLIGASYAADYDGLKVAAELDYFTGDADATTDAMGTQLMVDVSTAASEAATVGGRVFYALAADTDEAQISFLGNGFGGYDPLNFGPYENENLQNIVRPADAFTGTGPGAGVMALQVYANFKASDAVNVTGSVAYAQPEDDDMSAYGDNALFVNAGMTYALMQNATIKSQVQYVDYDEDPNDDANMSVGLGLWVNF